MNYIKILSVKQTLFTVSLYATILLTAFASAQSLSQIDSDEKKVIELINKERAKCNLKPCTEWDVLTYFAKVHSQNMASGKTDFGHDGFNDRAAGVQKYAQVLAFGENVAYCYNVDDPLKLSVKNWMNSPGHKKNIMDSYQETGVGIAYSKEGRCYITQLFATRRKQL